MKRYNFFLPEDIIEALRKESERTGVNISTLIRKVLSVYVAKLAEKHE